MRHRESPASTQRWGREDGRVNCFVKTCGGGMKSGQGKEEGRDKGRKKGDKGRKEHSAAHVCDFGLRQRFRSTKR